MDWGWDNARAILGLVVIVGIAWAISENRKAFPWKLVLGAVGLQFVFALLLFAVPPVRDTLFKANVIVDALEDATRYGTGFVFGYIGDNTTFPVEQANANPAFFFQILPIVIVVAALSAMLWHWHILRYITKAFAFIFAKTMGLGGATSLAVSANIFMGMTEAPVLVKPYIKGMTRSEVFVLMTTGFATIAGSVLIIYTTFLQPVMANPLAQLLTASIVAAPAAVALALTMVPESINIHDRAHEPDFEYESTMDAFSSGASTGLQIVLNIATMLIAALALLFMVNAMLAWLPDVNGAALSIQRILGWVFMPLMYMVGVPMEEAAKAGSLMGIKTVLTEFVAFLDLANTPPEELSDRSRIIVAHAICGFANFSSIGILIGGLTIIEPERRDLFLSLSWKTLIAGTLATCMSACIAGALPAALFLGGQGVTP
ncbi:MAG: nucleoside transporter [Ponticaulis sp.]|nr:nucleoside transporter [Ponticaulis sp.]